MKIDFLVDEPADRRGTILLAHGAGGAMDSPARAAIAGALCGAGFRVARFEFAYMAGRRSGRRSPPPKAERLIPEYLSAVEQITHNGPFLIGGKSMGGRVASMIADELYAARRIEGLLCIGYPFHPPGKPEQLRTAHLVDLKTPTLICQGTRDPFGTHDEAKAFGLSRQIEMFWLADGDHDLRPRKKLSGFTLGDHQAAVAAKTRGWADCLKTGDRSSNR